MHFLKTLKDYFQRNFLGIMVLFMNLKKVALMELRVTCPCKDISLWFLKSPG